MYRKRLRIISSMDPLQRTNLVNTNIIESKDLTHTSGKEIMRDPKKTTSITDVVISRILLRIAMPQKHLGALYQKSLKESKQAGDTRYKSHFNLASKATPEVGCSTQAPIEQTNNKTFEIEEKLPSTDSMLLDFGYGDMFGDLA